VGCGWEEGEKVPGAEGPGLAAGTSTIAEHCGQEALRPAAVEGTFSIRPQLVQANSIVAAGAAPNGAVVIGQKMRVSKVQSSASFAAAQRGFQYTCRAAPGGGRGLAECGDSPTVAT
jgi:hypothetical protein